MSAHVLLTLLNELGEIRCEAWPNILSISSNEFNKFNNTGASCYISYHMTLKSHLIRDFRFKTSRYHDVFMDVHINVTR